ncbi:hypothetical protein K440DRAFT_659028 [Wilcoxina mikolae CBS 423.85]|nr:hypothetical protein K440DRAFT_659028 [Wilcoxina mikolae CBS 423.85]
MSSPDPTIVVSNGTGSPNPPLELGKPPPEATTWQVRLFPQLNEAEGTELVVGKNPLPPEIDDDILAAFWYHPDGAIYLEAYSDAHPIYVSTTTSTHRTIRTKLRKSTISATNSERYYFILIQDGLIEFEGVTRGMLRFNYNTHEPSHPRAPMAPLAAPPQIQVMHSLPHGNSLYTTGNILGDLPDLVESTPGMTNEEKKVYETPAVKSRHVDPNSSPRRRPQASPSSAKIQRSRTGIMISGVPENGDDYTTDDSGDDLADFVPTAPMDMDSTSPEKRNSEEVGIEYTVPPDTIPSSAPIESPVVERPPPGEAPGDVEDLDLDEAVNADQNNIPDSLPEVFHYVDKKNNKAPGPKYGKKGGKRSIVLDETLARGITEETEDSVAPQTEDSSAPLTAAQKKTQGRKRKVQEDVSKASTKKRKGKDGTPVADEEDPEDELPTPKVTRDKGRGKKSTEVVPPSTEDNPPFSTAPEESSAAEDKPRKGSRKSTAKSTTTKPTPTPKSRKPSLQKKGSTQFNTQYTLPDDDENSESEAVHAPKTPKARGKATAPKKTPATAAKKSTASAKPSARKKTATARSTATPEPSATDSLRTVDHYEGTPPRISFTNSDLANSKSILRFLRSHNSKPVPSPSDPSCNYLVIGPGELKRTPKFVVAVARGIRIVEEQWLLDSQTAGYWVDPDPYVPTTPKEWDCDLSEALERGRKGETQVLKGKTVYLTPSLLGYLKQLKSEESLLGMLKAAGAEHVHKKAPRGEAVGDTLVLGKDEGEKDLDTLESGGWKVYGTAIIGLSVLRGKLEEADEFVVKATTGEKEPETKKRGGRKSTS